MTAATPPMRENHWLAWVIVIGLLLLFGIGNYVVDMSGGMRRLWADIWWTLSSLVAVLSCYRTAREPDLEPNLQRAWRLFGHACLAWFAGVLVWDYLELVRQQASPFPALSDLGFLLFAPLFIAGISHYHALIPSVPFRLLQASKLGIILCCIAIVHVVIFEEIIRDGHHPALYLIMALAYPVLYMSLFIQSLFNAAFYTWGRMRITTLILTLSVALAAIPNSFYAYATLHETYQAGSMLDILWVASFFLIIMAAWRQRLYSRKPAAGEERESLVPQYHWLEELFAPLAMLGTLVILYIFRANLEEAIAHYLFIAGILLAGLMGIRELVSKRIENMLMGDLRKSEAQYKNILDNMHDTYYRTDEKGVLIMVSPSVTALLGFRPDEIIGKPLSSLYADPENRQRFLEALHASGGAVKNYEVALRCRDGNLVWVSTNSRILRGDNGELTGVEGTTRDVTERKRIYETLRSAHQELERRVRERTADLEEARRVAEKASDAKSEFLSRMSHELRTPLNAILGFAQLLEADHSIIDEDQQGNIKEILSSGYYLLELINEILDLSQIESGTLVISREAIEVDAVIRKCLSMVKPIADANGVKLLYQTQAQALPKVFCDETRLRQALINLLSNAVKYNRPNGKVTVSCHALDHEFLRISIIDTGFGIPEGRQDKLFVPFERLGAERLGVQGTGIGLTISKRLIEMMDGKLELMNTSPEGSYFFIDLPVAKQNETGPRQTA